MPDPLIPRSMIEAKILHLLRIYPVVSPSMLQALLGNTPPKVWRATLDQLIKEGHIIQDNSPTVRSPADRYQSYKRIYLTEMESLVESLVEEQSEGDGDGEYDNGEEDFPL